jgi:hypothetical protein
MHVLLLPHNVPVKLFCSTDAAPANTTEYPYKTNSVGAIFSSALELLALPVILPLQRLWRVPPQPRLHAPGMEAAVYETPSRSGKNQG